MEYLRSTSRRSTPHDLWFVLFSLLSLIPFAAHLEDLARLSLNDARYSHILLIPMISASLLYLNRRQAFAEPQYCLSKGVPLLAIGLALFWLTQTRLSNLSSGDRLSVEILSSILVWMAGFVLCYGENSFSAALFPWMFLLFMVPLPAVALDYIVSVLQRGSAVMTYGIFKLLGVPVFWRHFKFLLPGVEIEIAPECSGVRSSTALLITSVLAGYLFLQSNRRRAVFSIFTIPVVIFKNAVRIVTISCLGVYVDPRFLHGKLHQYGGIPFSFVSLAILVPVMLALRKSENRSPGIDQDGKTVEPDPYRPVIKIEPTRRPLPHESA
jgi:exosortase